MEKKLPLDTIGERIRFVRSVLNLTQVTVSETMGITKQTLIRYEKNDRKPNDNFLTLFSKEFNVDLSWLVSGDGIPYNFFRKPILLKVTYDRHLLLNVIIGVERYFENHNILLSKNLKADMIVSLYEFYHDQQEDIRKQTNDRDFVIQTYSIENTIDMFWAPKIKNEVDSE